MAVIAESKFTVFPQKYFMYLNSEVKANRVLLIY